MPTYEYECQECGHRFEVFQRIADDPISACGKCSGKVRKVILPVGILFKGSGFYVNDYRKPESKGGNGSEKGTEAKTEKLEEAKKS